MQKNILIIFFVFIALSAKASYNPNIVISNVSVQKADDSVTITFTVAADRLNKSYNVNLTPVIYAEGHRMAIPPIIINSRHRPLTDERKSQIKTYGNSGPIKQKIVYETRIPYETWMHTLSLRLDKNTEHCCNGKPMDTLLSIELISNQIIHEALVPVIRDTVKPTPLSDLLSFDQVAPFLYPSSDYKDCLEIFKQQREKGALVVYFKQGSSTIDLSYMENKTTLDQVDKVLDLIEADPNANLKKIVIFGLSSPEGTLAANYIQSGKRALALKNHISKRLKNSDHAFDIINGSEDWDGLKKLIEASNMPDKMAVLDIIEKYPIPEGRERKLMDLKGGDPYRYMFKHFFPQLRNAGYIQIYYESTPDPDIETLQKATTLLHSKKYREALVLLLTVGIDKRVDNLIGVCYMMLGDYSKAVPYFEKAISYGDPNASTNLSNMNKNLHK